MVECLLNVFWVHTKTCFSKWDILVLNIRQSTQVMVSYQKVPSLLNFVKIRVSPLLALPLQQSGTWVIKGAQILS